MDPRVRAGAPLSASIRLGRPLVNVYKSFCSEQKLLNEQQFDVGVAKWFEKQYTVCCFVEYLKLLLSAVYEVTCICSE